MAPNKDEVTFIVYTQELPYKYSIQLAHMFDHEC
jgi:hypothetical protein